MRTKTKISGIAISSVPVYLINHRIEFKYNSEKDEIWTWVDIDTIKPLLQASGFTDEMIQFKTTK